jgi:hypothetical protein
VKKYQAYAEVMLACCDVCDQAFALTVTWFGDPMWVPTMKVQHLDHEFHRPQLTLPPVGERETWRRAIYDPTVPGWIPNPYPTPSDVPPPPPPSKPKRRGLLRKAE